MNKDLEELKDIAYDFSEAYKQSNVPESQLYGAGANKKEEYQDWSEKDDKLFKALDKLGQLEDFEDELGCDLLTIYKATKSKIYTRDGYAYFPSFNSIEQDSEGNYYWSFVSGDYYLKNYGVTWALTKEELE